MKRDQPTTDEPLKIEPGAKGVPDYRVDPVPRVPHKLVSQWSLANIVRILFLAGLLALVIVGRKPCSDSVATFVDSFGEPYQGSPSLAPAGASEQAADPRKMKLERLTPEEIRERFGQEENHAPAPNDAGGLTTP